MRQANSGMQGRMLLVNAQGYEIIELVIEVAMYIKVRVKLLGNRIDKQCQQHK
jgi:hypothetical protein